MAATCQGLGHDATYARGAAAGGGTQDGDWVGGAARGAAADGAGAGWTGRESAAVRLTSSRWRRIHDEGRKTLELRDRATDEAVVAMRGRMPGLTDEGMRAVAELKSLTFLALTNCSLVTDMGVRAVAELKCLTCLSLGDCSLTEGVRALAGIHSPLDRLLHLSDRCGAAAPHQPQEPLLPRSQRLAAAEEELRQQIPGLEIEHAREAVESDEDSEGELFDRASHRSRRREVTRI